MSALLKKEIIELYRTGKLWILLAVFGFFAIMSPVSAYYMPEIFAKMSFQQGIEIKMPPPTWMDAMTQYFKNISQICTFIIILLFMGTVAMEKETGTAVFLIIKPVSRTEFILSKMLSSCLLIGLVLMVSIILTISYTWLFFGEFPVADFVLSNIPLFLFLSVIMLMTIMFSTVAKSQFLAAVLSFLAWLLLGLFSQLGKAGAFSPVRLTNEGMEILSGNIIHWQVYTGTAVLIILSVLISIITFRKWEPGN